MTTQSALIGDYFAGPGQGRFMGWQMAATNFDGFLFIAATGWMTGISPRLPFAIYALGFLYLPFLWFAIIEPERKPRQRSGAAIGAATGTATDAMPIESADEGAQGWRQLHPILGAVVLRSARPLIGLVAHYPGAASLSPPRTSGTGLPHQPRLGRMALPNG